MQNGLCLNALYRFISFLTKQRTNLPVQKFSTWRSLGVEHFVRMVIFGLYCVHKKVLIVFNWFSEDIALWEQMIIFSTFQFSTCVNMLKADWNKVNSNSRYEEEYKSCNVRFLKQVPNGAICILYCTATSIWCPGLLNSFLQSVKLLNKHDLYLHGASEWLQLAILDHLFVLNIWIWYLNEVLTIKVGQDC